VLTARTIADTASSLSAPPSSSRSPWPSLPLHGGVLDGLAAFGLVVVFAFAFEWLFLTMGLSPAAAPSSPRMGMIVFPLAFISSA
jgi:hypothetical protein